MRHIQALADPFVFFKSKSKISFVRQAYNLATV